MAGIARIAALAGGLALALWVVMSAVRTVVLPRGEPVRLTYAVFDAVNAVFRLRARGARSYEERDRRLALYAPAALVLLPFVWASLVTIGFTGVFWGLGFDPLLAAFELSGSSLLTLGFVGADNLPQYIAAFVEATIGLGLVALLISYLPSIYSAFQRRELLVAKLATRAGEPPSPIAMILRHQRLDRLAELDELWDDCETWFADVEETHTSQHSLVYFRSISHDRSWITAAGAVLDAAALRASTLDMPREPTAELCIRAGYLCLRRIADYHGIVHDDDPRPDDPISIHHDEFVDAYDSLARAGVPLRDREEAWQSFAGWRVNYDTVLLALAALVEAPYAPWSSDRSAAYKRVTFRRRNHRQALLSGHGHPPPEPREKRSAP